MEAVNPLPSKLLIKAPAHIRKFWATAIRSGDPTEGKTPDWEHTLHKAKASGYYAADRLHRIKYSVFSNFTFFFLLFLLYFVGCNICWKEMATPIQELDELYHGIFFRHVSQGCPFSPVKNNKKVTCYF